MRTKENKKGISLIVLIVTIIVVIILAAVVILTLSKNNPIESAKEARFKEDIRTFQDELALAVSKEYADAGGHRDEKITATNYEAAGDPASVYTYIPSFSKKYEGKFVIQDDELRYTKQLDENEKEYAQNLNLIEKIKLLPDEFQQVEYIEAQGFQYIDTGLKANVFPIRIQYSAAKSNLEKPSRPNGNLFPIVAAQKYGNYTRFYSHISDQRQW